MNIDFNKLSEIKNFSKNLNVLYVEDNEEARLATMDVLAELFENIDIAINGEEGLEEFKSKNYDLIITDINMPKMDGITMLKEIRAINNDIPVLIVSAYNESGYFMETIRLNVEGYILKPLELDQFIEIVFRVIEKIKLKHENLEYQKNLEDKIKEQIDLLRHKDKILIEREKFARLGEMIDAIAHQFRQPLGIMRLQNQEIEYLLKEELKLDNNDLENALESSQSQLNHLLGTIEEFRGFFRPDYSIEQINLKELINSVLVLLKDEIIKHTVMVEVECSDDLSINIIPNEFKHVIINIIQNALDEFEKSDISDRTIIIRAFVNEGNISIEIEDNAGGIPEHVIDHIFKADFTTKGLEKGTGIGLYLSKVILEKVQAKINATNRNSGAVFTIGIPKA